MEGIDTTTDAIDRWLESPLVQRVVARNPNMSALDILEGVKATLDDLEERFPGVPFSELLDTTPDRTKLSPRAWDALSADMHRRGYNYDDIERAIGKRPAGVRWGELPLDPDLVQALVDGTPTMVILRSRHEWHPTKVRYHRDRLGMNKVRDKDREIGTWLYEGNGTRSQYDAMRKFGVNIVTVRRALYKYMSEVAPLGLVPA